MILRSLEINEKRLSGQSLIAERAVRDRLFIRDMDCRLSVIAWRRHCHDNIEQRGVDINDQPL